jgi:hypothetical protein
MTDGGSVEAVIQRYRTKGVLVDSSLLVVYLVGNFDQRHLVNCRAIKSSFTLPEFTLLANLIGQFELLVTTPHILAEVSNLSGKLPAQLHAPFREFFARAIPNLEEQTVAASRLAEAPQFVRFGITDTAISMVAREQFLVLTEEAALYGHLSKQGVDVINFSHIRLSAR